LYQEKSVHYHLNNTFSNCLHLPSAFGVHEFKKQQKPHTLLKPGEKLHDYNVLIFSTKIKSKQLVFVLRKNEVFLKKQV